MFIFYDTPSVSSYGLVDAGNSLMSNPYEVKEESLDFSNILSTYKSTTALITGHWDKSPQTTESHHYTGTGLKVRVIGDLSTPSLSYD